MHMASGRCGSARPPCRARSCLQLELPPTAFAILASSFLYCSSSLSRFCRASSDSSSGHAAASTSFTTTTRGSSGSSLSLLGAMVACARLHAAAAERERECACERRLNSRCLQGPAVLCGEQRSSCTHAQCTPMPHAARGAQHHPSRLVVRPLPGPPCGLLHGSRVLLQLYTHTPAGQPG